MKFVIAKPLKLLKFVVFFLLFILFIFLLEADVVAVDCETRASWINNYSMENVSAVDLVDQLESAGLNTVYVLTPEMRDEEGNLIGKGYTQIRAFENFIKEAKDRGFSVHVWIVNKYRDYSSQVDFRDPVEQEAQVYWVQSLLEKDAEYIGGRYKDYLDGVHLDYIRYGDWEDVNIEGKMDGVSVTVGKIYDVIHTNFPNKFLSAAVFSIESGFEEDYRDPPRWEEDVPQWFRNWYADYPGNTYQTWTLSDGVRYVGVPRQMKYQQDAVSWISQGNIDHPIPMLYNYNDYSWNRQVRNWKSFFEYNSLSIDNTSLGLAWYGTLHYEDPAHVVRKIKYGRSVGFKNFSIFELSGNYKVDDQPLVNALTVDSAINDNNAPFKSPAISCFLVQEPSPTSPPLSPTSAPVYTMTDVLVLINDWQTENPDSLYDLNRDAVVNSYDYAIILFEIL